jgi:hypothetical protein
MARRIIDRDAVKVGLTAKVAIIGCTGSGKTWTALEWATILADGKPVRLVDTENDSALFYADRYKFRHAPWAPPYDINELTDYILQSETDGIGCLVIDSASHFWEGEGGALDAVDAAGSRGNSFSGWKTVTPQLRHMIDVMRNSKMHIIFCLRSKMEYVVEKDEKTGKSFPRKVGMAPVFRAGLEYEFTLVGEMDLEHRFVVTKSRTDVCADLVAQPHRAGEIAVKFAEWLASGESVISAAEAKVLTDLIDDGLPGVENKLRRARIKQGLMELYGPPASLTTGQVVEVKEWIGTAVANTVADVANEPSLADVVRTAEEDHTGQTLLDAFPGSFVDRENGEG